MTLRRISDITREDVEKAGNDRGLTRGYTLPASGPHMAWTTWGRPGTSSIPVPDDRALDDDHPQLQEVLALVWTRITGECWCCGVKTVPVHQEARPAPSVDAEDFDVDEVLERAKQDIPGSQPLLLHGNGCEIWALAGRAADSELDDLKALDETDERD